MTTTNRFLNRLFVLVIGLVLLVGGAAVAAGSLLPDIQNPVTSGAKDAVKPTSDALSGSQPWILWVTAAAALVLILLLLWFVFRQGHGRTGTLLTVTEGKGRDATTGGTLVVDAKVAAQVLEESLKRDPAILAIDVVAFRIKKENVLRITAETRRGASPIEVRKTIDQAVAEWDSLLGSTTPVVIQLVAGIRSRTGSTTRVA